MAHWWEVIPIHAARLLPQATRGTYLGAATAGMNRSCELVMFYVILR